MSTTSTYLVDGMTCGHCVSSVTAELTQLPGVESVEIDLVPGGASPVRVVSRSDLSIDDVRAAVSEAGYRLGAPAA